MGSALTRTTGDRTKTKHSVFWRDLFRFKRNKARWSIWCLGICCQHLIPLFHWLNCALPRMESFFSFSEEGPCPHRVSPRLTAPRSPSTSPKPWHVSSAPAWPTVLGACFWSTEPGGPGTDVTGGWRPRLFAGGKQRPGHPVLKQMAILDL